MRSPYLADIYTLWFPEEGPGHIWHKKEIEKTLKKKFKNYREALRAIREADPNIVVNMDSLEPKGTGSYTITGVDE